MLQHLLYEIIEENRGEAEEKFSFKIRWITNSKIFEVHFPSKPITPGACLLEIARELFEKHFSTKFLIQKVKSIKYLKLIEPTKTPTVIFHFAIKEIAEKKYKVQILISDLGEIYTKLALYFIQNNE